MTDHIDTNDRLARDLSAHVDLARIPGQYLSMAMGHLPAPSDQPASGEVDVPEIGRVRVWFRMIKGRRGARDFWTIERAERVG
jgi:hypothetical protein